MMIRQESKFDRVALNMVDVMPLDQAITNIITGILTVVAWMAMFAALGIRLIYRMVYWVVRYHWRDIFFTLCGIAGGIGFFYLMLALCWLIA